VHRSPPWPWHAHSGFDLHSCRRCPGPSPMTAETRRPPGADCGRLLAGVCAKYVPKFEAATLIPRGEHAPRSEPVPALPLLLPLPQATHTDGATAVRSVADEYVAGVHHPAAMGAGLGLSGCRPRCAEQGDLCARLPRQDSRPFTHMPRRVRCLHPYLYTDWHPHWLVLRLAVVR